MNSVPDYRLLCRLLFKYQVRTDSSFQLSPFFFFFFIFSLSTKKTYLRSNHVIVPISQSCAFRPEAQRLFKAVLFDIFHPFCPIISLSPLLYFLYLEKLYFVYFVSDRCRSPALSHPSLGSAANVIVFIWFFDVIGIFLWLIHPPAPCFVFFREVPTPQVLSLNGSRANNKQGTGMLFTVTYLFHLLSN